MNLTTPPPVEELDREYAETLRRNAVRGAYKAFRPRPSRWVPLLAGLPIAALVCAIAVSSSGVGAQNRSSDPLQPAGRPTTVVKAPAAASRVESVDLGPATEADRRAAARECMTPIDDPFSYLSTWRKPEYAETSTIRSSRWIKDIRTPGGRTLLQTFETPDAVLFACQDGLVKWWGRADDFVKIRGAEVVSESSWGWGAGADPGVAATASYEFRAADSVASVQMRLRGVDGVSPWYSVKVVDHLGLVSASLPGTPVERPKINMDVRAFDKSGRQVWSKTYGR